MPDALYRRFFEQGRICPEDLTQVLAPLASERRVLFAGREVSHQDVLRLSMVHGLGEALPSQADRSVSAEGNPDELTSWLATVVGQARTGQAEALIPRAPVEVLSHETLSTWCDRTLGTSLVVSACVARGKSSLKLTVVCLAFVSSR